MFEEEEEGTHFHNFISNQVLKHTHTHTAKNIEEMRTNSSNCLLECTVD